MKTQKVISSEVAQGMRRKLGTNQSVFWNKVLTTQSAGSRYESGRNPDKRTQLLLRLAYDDNPLRILAEFRGCKVEDLK